jgi:hypothetical protein
MHALSYHRCNLVDRLTENLGRQADNYMTSVAQITVASLGRLGDTSIRHFLVQITTGLYHFGQTTGPNVRAECLRARVELTLEAFPVRERRCTAQHSTVTTGDSSSLRAKQSYHEKFETS